VDKAAGFKAYKKLCQEETNRQDLSKFENIHLRSYYTWNIDHKISIDCGFKNDVSVQDICHLSNLRLITRAENMRKNKRSLVDQHNNWIILKYNIQKIDKYSEPAPTEP
jgi:hypothetical protein